jgi:hypothetical protein
MMKIAIIEDRIARLEQYTDFDLKNSKSVTIITGIEFDKLIDSLKSNDLRKLDQYECIASHRSAMSNEVRDTLKEYCRKNKKPLIFFSGGITSSVLKDAEFPFLHINSKEFYSENLKLFIVACEEHNTVNLLLLQFGKKWKLSLLLNLRNNIAVSLNKQELKTKLQDVEIDDSEFIKRVRDLQINSAIKGDLLQEKTENVFSGDDLSPISFEQIQNIRYILDRLINEMA